MCTRQLRRTIGVADLAHWPYERSGTKVEGEKESIGRTIEVARLCAVEAAEGPIASESPTHELKTLAPCK